MSKLNTHSSQSKHPFIGESVRHSLAEGTSLFNIMENFKPVPNYEGIYEVSNFGNIRSVDRSVNGKNNSTIKILGKLRCLRLHHGYPFIGLNNKQSRKNFFVHRLVAFVFIPNPENKPFVNHKNGIKTDNRIENLEWATQSENEIHAHKTGLKNHTGQNHPFSKLKDADVLNIRELLKSGNKVRSIAKKYSISESVISQIKNNKKWQHVK